MSFPFIVAALDAKGLSSAQKITLACLANRANDGGVCFPSQATIALDTGLSTRHVYRCLIDLHQKGVLGWRQENDNQDRRRKKNVYTLNLDEIKGLNVKHDRVADKPNIDNSLLGHGVTHSTPEFTTAKSLSELAG